MKIDITGIQVVKTIPTNIKKVTLGEVSFGFLFESGERIIKWNPPIKVHEQRRVQKTKVHSPINIFYNFDGRILLNDFLSGPNRKLTIPVLQKSECDR